MRTRFIAEVGSTHTSKWDYCKFLIEECAQSGFDAIKFQLFPNTLQFTGSGNVHMPYDLFLRCYREADDNGIDCSASVFGEDEFNFLKGLNPRFIKFAYSQKHQSEWVHECIDLHIEPIVSCDVMTDFMVSKKATRLFCIPHYPVYYEISFDEIFPRFDGFSDHTLGIRQTLNAIEAGATTIEKHIRMIAHDVKCPDSYFSITLADAKNMITMARNMEKRGL